MKNSNLVFAIVVAISVKTMANQIVIDNLQSQYKTQTIATATHTEYREEQVEDTCSREVQIGSHQECRDIPGDQICNTVGGGQECRDIPGEEVCNETGGGEECQDVGGGQECHEVGGGQSCGLTPSGYQCHDVPGHQECTYVPPVRQCYLVPGHRECYMTPGRQECYDLPSHQDCYMTPGHQECSEVPDYKTEYYTCTRTVSVPYQVKDFDLVNDILVQVELNQNLPKGIREVIDLAQSAQALIINSVKSTAKVLVYATQQAKLISDNGHLRKIKTVVNIKMLDRALVLGAFSMPMSEITTDANGLQVTTGLIINPTLVSFNLQIVRKKSLGKSEEIINRTVNVNEMLLTNSENKTLVRVDFQKLGILDKIAGKKVHIELSMSAKASVENLVNLQDVPANLTQKKELDTKIK